MTDSEKVSLVKTMLADCWEIGPRNEEHLDEFWHGILTAIDIVVWFESEEGGKQG